MQYLKIYDEKTRMFPSGKIATKEVVYANYPAVQVFPHVITTDESDQVIFSINNLSAMRSQYGIDSALTNEEAVSALQEILNNPPEPAPAALTPEERSAAALEAMAAGQTTENAEALNILLGEA